SEEKKPFEFFPEGSHVAILIRRLVEKFPNSIQIQGVVGDYESWLELLSGENKVFNCCFWCSFDGKEVFLQGKNFRVDTVESFKVACSFFVTQRDKQGDKREQLLVVRTRENIGSINCLLKKDHGWQTIEEFRLKIFMITDAMSFQQYQEEREKVKTAEF
ncbi:MAG: hypothetical protein WCT18_02610, partial [Patescibacteria group bacterium]